MVKRIHLFVLKLIFPAGISAGEGGNYNRLVIARNGMGHPVLRGTSLSGVLRHQWRKWLKDTGKVNVENQVEYFFGSALGNEFSEGSPSRIEIQDSVLSENSNNKPVLSIERTHHLRNRHSGTVVDGGLFSLESCPPGVQTEVALWIRDDEKEGLATVAFLRAMGNWFEQGLTMGGKANRGVGLAQLTEKPLHRVYDLAIIDDHAAYLDHQYQWRNQKRLPNGLRPFESDENKPSQQKLTVRFKLAIPRGQDILVADGQGLDHEMEPQRVVHADGKTYWRIPGSTLRGIFRSWINRLASKEGKSVVDSAERQQPVWKKLKQAECDSHEQANHWLSGENLGWCFATERDRENALNTHSGCPVASLFGSLIQRGRLHVSDGLAEQRFDTSTGRSPEEQMRMHVAVDRITGGAAESMLFDNTVLTAYADGCSPIFEFTMFVDRPSADDARWLSATLRAIDLGILRVGSSKSSGRLSLTESPRASGPFQTEFTNLFTATKS